MASSNESNAQQEKQESFKTQLDKAAVDQRERDQDPKPNPIVEKIAEFTPAAGQVLAPKEKPREERPEIPGPPERPHHDHNIEEFVRDQHRSNMPGGDLNSVAQD